MEIEATFGHVVPNVEKLYVFDTNNVDIKILLYPYILYYLLVILIEDSLSTSMIVTVSADRQDCIGQLKRDSEILRMGIYLQSLETAPSENPKIPICREILIFLQWYVELS